MVLGTLSMKESLAFLDLSKLDFAIETGLGTLSRKYLSSVFPFRSRILVSLVNPATISLGCQTTIQGNICIFGNDFKIST